MKNHHLNKITDLGTLLKKGKISSEMEHERALMMHRTLRTLIKDQPELAEKRKALSELIKAYEQINWNTEVINAQLIAESDAAETSINQERIFLAHRKTLIKDRLKSLQLTQKEFGQILGHSSATYISELVNGVSAFSMRDIALIHALLKISYDELIPNSAIYHEKQKVVASVHEIKPGLLINELTLELQRA